jgi:hypothetical protein
LEVARETGDAEPTMNMEKYRNEIVLPTMLSQLSNCRETQWTKFVHSVERLQSVCFARLAHDDVTEMRAAEQTQAHDVIGELYKTFLTIDTDASGHLEHGELMVMLRQHYRKEGVARSRKHVQTEINAALDEFAHMETDISGAMNFTEFVTMICLSTVFKFKKLELGQKEAVLHYMFGLNLKILARGFIPQMTDEMKQFVEELHHMKPSAEDLEITAKEVAEQKMFVRRKKEKARKEFKDNWDLAKKKREAANGSL